VALSSVANVDCSLWTEKEGYSQEVMMMEVAMLKMQHYQLVIMMVVEVVLDDTEMVHALY
jgi:hypothetical protein